MESSPYKCDQPISTRPLTRGRESREKDTLRAEGGCAVSLKPRESEPQPAERDAVLGRGSPRDQEANGPVSLMRRRRVDRAQAGVQCRSHEVTRLRAPGRRTLTARPLRRVGCLTGRNHSAAATSPGAMGRAAAATTTTRPLRRPLGGIGAGGVTTARKSRHRLDGQSRRQHPGDHFRTAR